jgi:hypothetical protein
VHTVINLWVSWPSEELTTSAKRLCYMRLLIRRYVRGKDVQLKLRNVMLILLSNMILNESAAIIELEMCEQMSFSDVTVIYMWV